MSPDPLTGDEGQQGGGKRANFIGRVKFSRVDCDCEICTKGNEAAEEKGYDFDTDYDHFMAIEPLKTLSDDPDDEYDKDMHILGINIPERGSFASKWMVQMGYLTEIHGNLKGKHGIEGREDLPDLLDGQVYEFTDITWTEDEPHPFEQANMTLADVGEVWENSADNMLVPIRALSEEEVAEETGDEVDTGKVEEVNIGE